MVREGCCRNSRDTSPRRSARAPGLGRVAELPGRGGAGGLEQAQVARGEGVGPSQGPHGDILRGPVAQARVLLQRRDGGLGMRARPEVDLSTRRGPGEDADRRGPRRGDAHRRQLAVVGPGEPVDSGTEPVQARERSLDWVAEPSRQAAGERRSRAHRDPLAQDGPSRHLEAVERARHPQAREPLDGPGDPRVMPQVLGDRVRPRVQVEEVFEPTEDIGQSRHELHGQLDRQRVPAGDRLDPQPAPVCADRRRSKVGRPLDPLHTEGRPAGQEADHRLPRQGRAVGQRQPERVPAQLPRRRAPHAGGRQPVVRRNKALNRRTLSNPLAKAIRAIGRSDSVSSCLARSSRRVWASSIGETPYSDRTDRRSCRSLRPRSRASFSTLPPSFRAPASIRAAAIPRCGPRRQPGHGRAPARGGTAGTGGSHPSRPSPRRRRTGSGHGPPSRRADRPTVNPRGRDPHEEHPVESRVAGRQGPIACLGVDQHGSLGLVRRFASIGSRLRGF